MRHDDRERAIYQLHVHFALVTRLRRPVLRGEVGLRLREVIRQICTRMDVEIVKGHVRPDHVHLLLSLPPDVAPSRAMKLVKRKTSGKLMREFRHLEKAFAGRRFWARGYFAASSGNVSDEMISKYVEEQDAERSDEHFEVTDAC